MSDPQIILEALIRNSEAFTQMSATLNSLQADFHRGIQSSNTKAAKLENLDRSVAELRLVIEQAEEARIREFQRILDLLGSEREDRKEITRTQGLEDRELLRKMVHEEKVERQMERSHLTAAAREIWRVGGRYLVAGCVLLIVSAIMKFTGLSLKDIIGVATGP